MLRVAGAPDQGGAEMNRPRDQHPAGGTAGRAKAGLGSTRADAGHGEAPKVAELVGETLRRIVSQVDHQREVAGDFASAADIARDRHPFHPGKVRQRLTKDLGLPRGLVPELEGPGTPHERDAPKDLLRAPDPEARQPGQPAVPGGILQLLDGLDAEPVAHRLDPLEA